MNRQRQDRRIFEGLTRFLDQKKTSTKHYDEIVLDIGRFFLGAPYGAGTLETKGVERLVVNLKEFDCFTFVENVVALAWQVESKEKSFPAFKKLLQRIRYRRGQLKGYSSRLHYFSDWIHDNQKKGILRDVTAKIGGRPLRKTVNFLTTNSNRYPPLKNAAELHRLKSIERRISKRSLFFIPKKALRFSEDRIHGGDLVAITTNIEGLDVQHVGLAARVKERLHMIHASSTEGKVVLSKRTLYRYLMQSKARSGILVARVTMKHGA